MLQQDYPRLSTIPRKYRQEYQFILFVLIFLFFTYILNRISPLWGDDFRYSFIDTHNYQRVNDFSDILTTPFKRLFIRSVD